MICYAAKLIDLETGERSIDTNTVSLTKFMATEKVRHIIKNTNEEWQQRYRFTKIIKIKIEEIDIDEDN